MQIAARYGTRDVPRAKIFYDEIAQILGANRVIDQPGLVGYQGATGGMLMVGKPLEGDATAGNGTQITLAAPNRKAVDDAHAKAIELGGKCEGKPGVRNPEAFDFYVAYFRDPDGNKLNVGCMGNP